MVNGGKASHFEADIHTHNTVKEIKISNSQVVAKNGMNEASAMRIDADVEEDIDYDQNTKDELDEEVDRKYQESNRK